MHISRADAQTYRGIVFRLGGMRLPAMTMRAGLACFALAAGFAPAWAQAASSAPSSAPVGTFAGTYRCGQGQTDVVVTLDAPSGKGKAKGVFDFYYPNIQQPRVHGTYEFISSYNTAKNILVAKPSRWLKTPGGYSMVGFTASYDAAAAKLSGKIKSRGCQNIDVVAVATGAPAAQAMAQAKKQLQAAAKTAAAEDGFDPKALVGTWMGYSRQSMANLTVVLDVIDPPQDSVAQTPIARLKLDSVLTKCEYAMNTADIGDNQAVLYAHGRGDKCPTGALSLGYADGQILAQIGNVSARLSPRLQGHMRSKLPDFAVLGVKLGDRLDDLQSLTQAPVQGEHGDTDPRPVKSMIGYVPSNVLDGRYRTVLWPRETPPAGITEVVHADAMAAYDADRNGTIDAFVRRWVPAKDKSPNFDQTLAALKQTYGTPTAIGRRGGTTTYEWAYDQNGQLVSGTGADRACSAKINTTMKDSYRKIAVHYNKVDLNQRMTKLISKPTKLEAQLVPKPDCGATLVYSIRPNKSSGIESMTAFAFSHAVLAGRIWQGRASTIASDIAKGMRTMRNQDQAAPKL